MAVVPTPTDDSLNVSESTTVTIYVWSLLNPEALPEYVTVSPESNPWSEILIKLREVFIPVVLTVLFLFS